MQIDRFYLSSYDIYKKSHLFHDIFIYGYDAEKNILYASDFFRFGKYSRVLIQVDEFQEAFEKYSDNNHKDFLNHMVNLYKFNFSCDYEFNVNNIFNSIRAYLNKETPEYWELFNIANLKNNVFGTAFYSILRNYILQKIMDDDFEIDIRPFYLLYDHKKMMALRLLFLFENEYLSRKDYSDNYCENIEKQAKILVTMVLKFNIGQIKSLSGKILKLLLDIEGRESEILFDMLYSK